MRAPILERMSLTLAEWREFEPEADWLNYQREYREAANTIEGLLDALEGLIDTDPCWQDHNGNCQAHGISNPCEMAVARAAIAKAEGRS